MNKYTCKINAMAPRLCILALLLGLSSSSLLREILPADPDTPGCVKDGVVHKLKEEWFEPGKCLQKTCNQYESIAPDYEILTEGCSTFQFSNGNPTKACGFVKNISLNYPDCCPSLKCVTIPNVQPLLTKNVFREEIHGDRDDFDDIDIEKLILDRKDFIERVPTKTVPNE